MTRQDSATSDGSASTSGANSPDASPFFADEGASNDNNPPTNDATDKDTVDVELSAITSELDPTDPNPQGKQVSIYGAVVNVANYVVGAGLLGLPFVFMKAGFVWGLVLLVIIGVACYTSFELLLTSSAALSCFSYESLARATGGESFGPAFSNIVKVIIVVDSFGALTAYMNIIGNTFHAVIANHSGQEKAAMWYSHKDFLAGISILVLILPLSTIRNINKLGFTSMLSLIPLVYLVLLQAVSFFSHGTGQRIRLVDFKDFWSALPIVVFAFNSQQTLFPVYEEMRVRGGGRRDIDRALRYAVGVCGAFYAVTAIFGYLEFGALTEDNILLNFGGGTEVDILLVTTALSIVLSYPVIMFPARFNIEALLFPNTADMTGHDSSFLRFFSINMLMVAIAYGISVAIPRFASVLGIFGSFTGTLIGYALPASFLLFGAAKQQPEAVSKTIRIIAWVILVGMSILGGISSYYVIRDF